MLSFPSLYRPPLTLSLFTGTIVRQKNSFLLFQLALHSRKSMLHSVHDYFGDVGQTWNVQLQITINI